MPFRNAVDIANRALQHVGAGRISDTEGFNEDSKNASETSFVYDKLRQAELRRNVWRFAIRQAILRPIDSATFILAPALWSSLTTYYPGDLVTDVANIIWQSVVPDNLNNAPEATDAWQLYFGPLAVQAYDSTTTYGAGEVVYAIDGGGSYKPFLSLENANSDNPAQPTQWDSTVTYHKDQIVISASILYVSLVSLNVGHVPAGSPTQWSTTIASGSGSLKWRQLTAALNELIMPYPIGAGSSFQSTIRRSYRLPAGFLRQAPKDPKAGSNSWIGASTALTYDDWNFEGKFITTSEVGPLSLRFVADIADVSQMDPLFCEGLAARIGMEICEAMTQSTSKVQTCVGFYKNAISEARTVNGIETGPVEAPEDDWVSCRA